MTPETTILCIRNYVRRGLAAMPDVLEALLSDLPDVALDTRPDPDRFTLRETMAHLADWETVWQFRLSTMQNQNNPILPSPDINQRAKEKNYAQTELHEQVDLFRTRRAALLEMLDALPDADLFRTGQHAALQTITIAELAGFIWGHDGYHLQQITDFRRILLA